MVPRPRACTLGLPSGSPATTIDTAAHTEWVNTLIRSIQKVPRQEANLHPESRVSRLDTQTSQTTAEQRKRPQLVIGLRVTLPIA